MSDTGNPLREKWDKRYTGNNHPGSPAQVLTANLDLLPKITSGKAYTCLDVACGLAANGLFLAAWGFNSYCWDISPVAIEKVRETARQQGLPVTAEVRDVELHPPAPEEFDVIVVSRFLHRPLCKFLARALKPGGRLFYQTFALTEDGSVPETGPQRREYRLGEGELLVLFPNFEVLRYHESPMRDEAGRPVSYESWLVAKKA